MHPKLTVISALLLSSVAVVNAQGTDESQKVTLSEKLKIPGASLKPGEYTFAIEDRLQDRAIVKITSQEQSKPFLVLTVPSPNLPQQGGDGLIRFSTPNGKDQVLRGWACPGCSPGLEFVYPKAEAAKLTDETTEAVLAVDPTYDKLPANLSPDDMKVVTLWLLSPERITASNKGKGVKAEKYASASQPSPAAPQTAATRSSELAQSPIPAASAPADVAPVHTSAASPAPTSSGTSELAQVPTPAPAAPTAAQTSAPEAAASNAPVQMASASGVAGQERSTRRLPKTASDDYLYIALGMLLLTGALGVRLSRRSTL